MFILDKTSFKAKVKDYITANREIRQANPLRILNVEYVHDFNRKHVNGILENQAKNLHLLEN